MIHVIYEFGEFRLDAGRRLLFRKDTAEALSVTPKVTEAIVLFVQHPGELLDKDRLMSELWAGLVVEEGSLTQVISNARRVLGETRGENRYIATVPGRGYRFVAGVSVHTPGDSPMPAPTPTPAPTIDVPPRRRLRVAVIVAAAVCVAALGAWLFASISTEPRSSNPLEQAVIHGLTDFEGSELDPAISADGKLIAFLSDRGGIYDVWVGGSAGGDFINLTKGRFARMHMDMLHTVGFSPDGTRIWFRAFERNDAGQDIPNIWLIPVTGGAPRRFLDNTTHLAWSPDGKRVVYQRYTAGDPLFVAAADGSDAQQIFVDEPGRHCHMVAWSPDGAYIYFVRGPHPTREMDLWRIRADGGSPERLTHHNARVGYPVPLDERTVLYTAAAADEVATSLYALDLVTRTTRRVNIGLEEYPTVSAGSGTNRSTLVATVTSPKSAIFTVPIGATVSPESATQRLEVNVAHAVAPRFGPDFVVFLASPRGAHGLYKITGGSLTQLWDGANGGVIGAPALTPDGSRIAFGVHKGGRNLLYTIRADGADPRLLTGAFDVLDAGSWSADARWLAISARDAAGSRIFKVAADGSTSAPLTETMSLLPLWSPDGTYVMYSHAVNGPGYAVRAVSPEGKLHTLPALWIPRGGDRYHFLPDGSAVVLLLEEAGRQNFWRFDVRTGERRQLTDLAQDASIRNFDVSRDGRQIVFDRVRENADVVVIDLEKSRQP